MDIDYSSSDEEHFSLPRFETPPPETDSAATTRPWLTARLGTGLLLSALAHTLVLSIWLARPASVESEPEPRSLRLTLQTQVATPTPDIETEPPVEPIVETPADPEQVNAPLEQLPAQVQAPAPSINYRTLNISDYYTPPVDTPSTSSSRVFDPRLDHQIAEAGRRRQQSQVAGQAEPTPWGGSMGHSSTAFGKGRCVYHTDQGEYIGMVLSRTLCPDPETEGEEIIRNLQRSLDNRQQ